MSLVAVRQQVTSLVLRKLIRNQGASSRVVMDTILTRTQSSDVKDYVRRWRIGHFT